MTQPLYTQLTHEQYKEFEQQLHDYPQLETTHTSGIGKEFYHKAFRIKIGDLILEVTGPIVKGWGKGLQTMTEEQYRVLKGDDNADTY